MSDRTRVFEQAEATSEAGDDASATRADRIMGRNAEGTSSAVGSGASSTGGSSPAAGSSGTGSSGPGSSAADPFPAAQRPTPVSGTTASPSSSGESASRRRPVDGWGRTSEATAASRDSSGAEDEMPTRVNPAVPTFRTPGRESASTGGSGTTGPATGARTAPVTAAAPGPATTEPSTAGTTTRTAVGTGSLGAVTKSMEAPAPESKAEPATPRGRAKPRKARRARLRLSRVDPWSVMKTSFLFSIALGIASWVAVAFVWWVIQQSGLFSAVNEIVSEVLQTPGDADPFRLEAYVNGSRVLGLTALLAVVDVILITALATVASFLYNLSATMLGGLQVTLAETDD